MVFGTITFSSYGDTINERSYFIKGSYLVRRLRLALQRGPTEEDHLPLRNFSENGRRMNAGNMHAVDGGSLSYGTVCSGWLLLTFWRIILPPSSTYKIKAAGSFKILVTTFQIIWCHNPKTVTKSKYTVTCRTVARQRSRNKQIVVYATAHKQQQRNGVFCAVRAQML
jgi:hypothetical protein